MLLFFNYETRELNVTPLKLIAYTLFIACAFAFIGYTVGHQKLQYNFQKNEITSKLDLQKQDLNMVELSNNSTLFLNYESAIHNYIKEPSENAKADYQQRRKQLDQRLQQAADAFGLTVKRHVNLFNAWQYNFEQILFTQPNILNQVHSNWTLSFFHYQKAINKSLSAALNDFEKNQYNLLLYGDHGIKQADSAVQQKVLNIYNDQVKTLIPQVVDKLRMDKKISRCLPDSSPIFSPQRMAQEIAILQYGSRYCPFLTRSRTQTFCYRVRNTPATPDYENNLNYLVAVCDIADKRLETEASQAKQEYGQYSDNTYLERYIVPLLKDAKEKLEQRYRQPDGTVSSSLCENSDEIPVVNFRDPQVDAEILAYVQLSDKVCVNKWFS